LKLKSKIYLDYDDILSMCQNLEYEVQSHKPALIVGITRGGLLPALHLSHHLERPMTTIKWQTREEDAQEYSGALQDFIDSGKHVVFVDDINDTGRTFSEISRRYGCVRPNVTFASLVKKVETTYPDAAASLTISDNRWFIFPWEKD
jgi:hypoxanthine phosphoribosyltransferase